MDKPKTLYRISLRCPECGQRSFQFCSSRDPDIHCGECLWNDVNIVKLVDEAAVIVTEIPGPK